MPAWLFVCKRWLRIEMLLVLAYVLAVTAYFFHALSTNPQYDNQVIDYALDLLSVLRDEESLPSYFLVVRKYPFLYTMPFAFVYGMFKFVLHQELVNIAIYALGRFISLLYALGTLFLLRTVSQMLSLKSAVTLLLTSLLFFLFSTAIRPHVAVTFFTLLSFERSLALMSHRNLTNTVCAFAAAIAAFCTLQSGLFAFVFPVFAFLGGQWRPKRIIFTGGLLGVSILIALLIGYSFVFRPLVGLQAETGLDLGHNAGLSFSLFHPFVIILQLLGSEFFLLVFFAVGVVRFWRKKDRFERAYIPIVLYMGIFILTFMFHPITGGRFFIPLLPFVALLGARAFDSTPFPFRQGVLLVMILAYFKLTVLALSLNTYERAGQFMMQRPGRMSFVAHPWYFYGVPPERLPTTEEQAETVQTVAIPRQVHKTLKGPWQPCAGFVASSMTDDSVLLWNETDWALLRIFEARALGPNIRVYCHSSG